MKELQNQYKFNEARWLEEIEELEKSLADALAQNIKSNNHNDAEIGDTFLMRRSRGKKSSHGSVESEDGVIYIYIFFLLCGLFLLFEIFFG